jgi:lysophospholipase L1-like esterase
MVRLPPILRSLAPEIVVLLEGVNDITFLEPRRVTQVAGYVNTMAHDARFAGAQVIICTLPPQRPGGLRAADPAAVSSYNQALRDVARGEAATLVDFANDFGNLSLIGADGLHPTEAGYSRMADILFDSVRRTFEMPLP